MLKQLCYSPGVMKRLAILGLLALSSLSLACGPPIDDDGSSGDGGGSFDGGSRDAGGSPDGGDGGGFPDGGDGGGGDGGGNPDGGGRDSGLPPGPCDAWPVTSMATPGCGPALLTVAFDSSELEAAYLENGCSYWGLLWDFGDGATSNQDFPTHTFSLGDYLVRADGEGECCDANSCYTLGLNLTDIPIRAH